jgi:hypothetical protein
MDAMEGGSSCQRNEKDCGEMISLDVPHCQGFEYPHRAGYRYICFDDR